MSVTFDPTNLRIVEVDTGQSSNEIEIREIYSLWKDWLLADVSRMRYPQTFRVLGGDPISDTENLGSTFFLNTGDGWRIRPAEHDHRLTLVGNLFTDPAGDVPVTTTLGNYTVIIEFRVSTLIEAARTETERVISTVEDWGVINFSK
jgi:hypothetical protein